ncbi:MAG: hypothetical protein A2252_07100 [Elusimicrobia bacterium RIFOXYA2_FULL_39_19]|nr:MAG: hypothetical protein A2252_07100 [Elusimicrobia bacterium RIFOXYA2_FULL_39_19]
MKCPKCGYENPESAKNLSYCTMCYEPFKNLQPQNAQPEPLAPGQPESRFIGNKYNQQNPQTGPYANQTNTVYQPPNRNDPETYQPDTTTPPVKKSNVTNYVSTALAMLIASFMFSAGPKVVFRSVFVLFDKATHSQTEFKDDFTGIKSELPDQWGWVLLISESEMISAYDLQSVASMGAKPIFAVRNKLYDAHVVFINFPKHIFGANLPRMGEVFALFTDGMSRTEDMKKFQYIKDETTTIDSQIFLKKSFSANFKNVDLEGFTGIFERKDSYIILLSMCEQKEVEHLTEMFAELKSQIRLAPEKNVYSMNQRTFFYSKNTKTRQSNKILPAGMFSFSCLNVDHHGRSPWHKHLPRAVFNPDLSFYNRISGYCS